MKIGLSPLLFAVVLAPRPAHGQSERIEKFSSDIVVARDGSLNVTETIKVYAAGDKIEHGIYRDLLTAGRVPDRVEIGNGAFSTVNKTTKASPGWATGGMRHGEKYQEAASRWQKPEVSG